MYNTTVSSRRADRGFRRRSLGIEARKLRLANRGNLRCREIPRIASMSHLAVGVRISQLENIDVAVPSSSQGDDLLFEAYTERIPPRGTPVTLELIPIFDKEIKPALKKPAAK